MIRSVLLGFACSFTLTLSALAQDASLGPLPRVLDDRLKLELFAEHPTLVTPTGIDVDHLGRVWVLESNTHFPPDGYQGHPSDRLLVLQDTDSDGKADKTTVFADGFKFAMSVVVQPVWLESQEPRVESPEPDKKDKSASPSGSRLSTLDSRLSLPVFVATRGEIVRLRDTNADLVADERTRLVHLETAGNYPHNGLAGIAFDALGWMYFGFGENLGADYKIIGSDGVTLSGGGEGGNMYRCRPDGSKLEKWATGFWNPHASCFDAFGRLFTVDNDPDSRPPCRLLHIIPGGDYGYRFRNGRRGTHPFTAWNGEIPGTLPMVSGTGEAPSGILCYESDGFPADYLGTLLVGSWGDHRIDQFVLEPKGASFVSKPKPIVQGTENFRPVGLALAPDGSIYFSDWVLRDYKLHRKGRVWKLSCNTPNNRTIDYAKIHDDPPYAEMLLEESLRLPARRYAANAMTQTESGRSKLVEMLVDPQRSTRARVEALWAIASIPHELHDLGLVPAGEKRIASSFDEVATAFIRCLRAPQFAGRRSPDDAWGRSWFNDGMNEASWNGFLRFHMASNDAPQELYEQVNWSLQSYVGNTPESDQDDPFVISSIILAVASRRGPTDFCSTTGPCLYHSATTEGMALTTKMCMLAGLRQVAVPPIYRLIHLLAAKVRDPNEITTLRLGLTDSSPMVRRAAIQWAGESGQKELRWIVEHELNQPDLGKDMLFACLATLSLLDGVPPADFEKTPPVVQLMKIVADDQRPAALRATALQMVPASTAELSTKLLLEFAKSGDAGLKTQAVRTLQQSGRADGIPLLLAIAADENTETSLRLDAIAGLCATPHDQPLPANIEQLLLDAINNRLRFRAASEQAQCRLEAIRALRGRGTPGSKTGEALRAVRETASGNRELVEALDLAIDGKSSSPSDSQLSTLNSQPTPDSGRRVFYHHQGPLCFKCHTVNGRGGNVGPDLSVIARTMNREKLLGSILEPSKEISPQFLTWTITTDDGKTRNGIMVTENGGGDVELGDIQGNITKIPRKSIEERAPSNVSVMPQGLHQRMTSRELSDLLDYLETLK